MKNTIFIAALCTLVILGSCKKDKNQNDSFKSNLNVSLEQNALMMFNSGTWCGNCGSKMKPAKEKLAKDNDSRVIMLSSHGPSGRDPLYNSLYDSLYIYQSGNGTACTIWGADEYNYYSHSSKTSISQWRSEIDKIKNQKSFGGVDLDWRIDGNQLKVNTKSKITKVHHTWTTQSKLKLAVYLLEDELFADQIGGFGSTADLHSSVVRASISKLASGDIVVNNPELNVDYEKSFSINLKEEWKKENLKVVAVLRMAYYNTITGLNWPVYVNAKVK